MIIAPSWSCVTNSAVTPAVAGSAATSWRRRRAATRRVGERLVEQARGPGGASARRERDALLLAARTTRVRAASPSPRGRRAPASADPSRVRLVPEAVADVAGDVHVRKERVVLEDHPIRRCSAHEGWGLDTTRSPDTISPPSGRSSPAISRSVVSCRSRSVRARARPARRQLEVGAIDRAHRAERLAQAAQAQAAAPSGCRAAVAVGRRHRYDATLPFALSRYSGGAAISNSSSAGIALAS